MNLKKYIKDVLFAKKHIQNLTFQSVVLSIQGTKKYGIDRSSLMKKSSAVFSLVCDITTSHRHLISV